MKKLLFSLLFVLGFAIQAQALTTVKGGVNVLPEPLPESPGQLIYEEMGCPMCHGHQGGGDGFMAGGLDPKPRNFTDFKTMTRLSDMTMAHSIKHGIPGTGMPAWNLTDNQGQRRDRLHQNLSGRQPDHHRRLSQRKAGSGRAQSQSRQKPRSRYRPAGVPESGVERQPRVHRTEGPERHASFQSRPARA